MMILWGLEPEETVSILEELARLAEKRRWEKTHLGSVKESQVGLHTEE